MNCDERLRSSVAAICREVTLALGDNERCFRSGAFCLTKKSAGQRDRQYDISVGHFCISDRTLTVTDRLYSGLGCALGSTVSPSLAIIFMDEIERRILDTAPDGLRPVLSTLDT